MPRIHNDYLECVFYLYPDIAHAEAGRQMGGTGFFLSVPFADGHIAYFAVTNRHVIEAGNTALRLNSADGGVAFHDTPEISWISHKSDDLSALCVDWIIGEHLPSVGYWHVLRSSWVDEAQFGPGDDTFSVGRVVSVDGVQRNTPTVRFGNVAQMGGEPIAIQGSHWARAQESILVEARSLSGFSGSPVFIYRPAFAPVHMSADGKLTAKAYQIGPILLGVDWGQINAFLEARDRTGKDLGYQIQSNAGLMAVVPGWKVIELIDNILSIDTQPARAAPIPKVDIPFAGG